MIVDGMVTARTAMGGKRAQREQTRQFSLLIVGYY